MHSKFRQGLWALADPKISITSASAMLIGVPLAARDGYFSWLWLLVTALTLFCFEVAKNASGDIYDYDSGTDLAVAPDDRTDFSGGKRVLVDHLLTRQQTWAVAAGFSCIGLILGGAILLWQSPLAIWLGLAGIVLAWSYHGPPLQLAYRGLGELDVMLCYGPLICMAAYVIQADRFSLEILWLSLPLGIFIAAFLWVNQFPDYDADRSHGKNNLVVKLGKQRASRVLPALYLAGYTILLLAPFSTSLPATVWLGFASAPTVALVCHWTWLDPQTFYRHKPVQPMALLSFVIYAAGVAVGVFAAA
jgi:1,4-dihydroxy-2-naphthoate octaprenyltransferase